MIIGHHILYGKEMELDQPVVAITKDNSQGIFISYKGYIYVNSTAAISDGWH